MLRSGLRRLSPEIWRSGRIPTARATRARARPLVPQSRRLYSSSSVIVPFGEDKLSVQFTNNRSDVPFDWDMLTEYISNIPEKPGDIFQAAEIVLGRPDAPRSLFSAILYSLKKLSDTRCLEHGELAIEVGNRLLEQHGRLTFANLSGIYTIVLEIGDAALNHAYFELSRSVTMTRRDRRKFIQHVILLNLSSGNIEASLDAVREAALANAGQVDLPYHLYEVLLMGIFEYGDDEYARQILEHLHASSNVFSRTWGLFISNACQHEHYENLAWAWKKAAIPGLVVLSDWCYEQMALIGRKHGDFAMVRWALLRDRRRKQTLGIANDADPAWQIFLLVSSHARSGDIASAFDVIGRLRYRQELPLDLLDLEDITGAIANGGIEAQNLAFKGLLSIRDDPKTTETIRTLLFNIFLGSLVKSGSANVVDLYSRGVFDFNTSYDQSTVLTMLDFSYQHQDRLLTRQILEDCTAYGIARTERIYKSALRSLEDDSNLRQQCLTLMEQDGINVERCLAVVGRDEEN